MLAMFTITNVSHFVLAAAIAMACVVLLLSSSSCPSGIKLALRNNETQADPSMRVRPSTLFHGIHFYGWSSLFFFRNGGTPQPMHIAFINFIY
jgi:hypothetical protein